MHIITNLRVEFSVDRRLLGYGSNSGKKVTILDFLSISNLSVYHLENQS